MTKLHPLLFQIFNSELLLLVYMFVHFSTTPGAYTSQSEDGCVTVPLSSTDGPSLVGVTWTAKSSKEKKERIYKKLKFLLTLVLIKNGFYSLNHIV